MPRYGAQKTTIDNITFASKKEANYYLVLRDLLRRGEISNLGFQPKFKVQINDKHYCTYTADFVYYDKIGEKHIVEVKSSGTRKDAAYRLRRKAAELYHDMKIEEVVM